MHPISDADFPAAHQSADKASLDGQRWHSALVRAELILVVVGAVLGVLGSIADPGYVQGIAIAAAFALAGALGARIYNQSQDFSRRWFDGRAVAESIKSETWRYMLKIEPFDDEATSDAEFARDIRAIIQTRPGIWRQRAAHSGLTGQISPLMRQVRALPMADRRSYYIVNRLDDQVSWYMNKSEANSKASRNWFLATVSAQVGALGVAILRVAFTSVTMSVVGLFTTLAAAATAWAQFRRHDELSKTYGLACEELRTIHTLAEAATTEDQLAEAVSDGEKAISREHTMWIAKRGEPIPTRFSD